MNLLEQTFHNYAVDQVFVPGLGPMSIMQKTLPFDITSSKTEDHYNFRLGILLHPRNPLIYSQLVTQFYTGIIDNVTNDFYGYDLKGVYSLDKSQVDPPGLVPSHMLSLIQTYIGLQIPRPMIPDIATMALVRINGTHNMTMEPTLVFYIDVPIKLYSMAALTLMGIMCQISEKDDALLQY